jgi:hypothetical protein
MRHFNAWMKNERDEVAQCKSENVKCSKRPTTAIERSYFM